MWRVDDHRDSEGGSGNGDATALMSHCTYAILHYCCANTLTITVLPTPPAASMVAASAVSVLVQRSPCFHSITRLSRNYIFISSRKNCPLPMGKSPQKGSEPNAISEQTKSRVKGENNDIGQPGRRDACWRGECQFGLTTVNSAGTAFHVHIAHWHL